MINKISKTPKSFLTPNDQETISKINEVIDYLNGNSGNGSYKVYTALLTQVGTNNPTAKVLQNTLGGEIVWTYTNVGDYVGTLIGAFAQDKTVTIPLIEKYQTNDLGGEVNIRVGTDTINTVKIKTTDNVFVDTDGILVDSPIEIRVYN